MIAPDANLLIYSYNPAAPQHLKSRRWLENIFTDAEPVGIPVLSLYAFLRFVTHPNHLQNPLRFSQAGEIVDSWLAVPNVRILYPGERHWQILQQLATKVRLSGAQITDAAIAAIAIEYGTTVHTNDRNFARFPGLRWLNPLEA